MSEIGLLTLLQNIDLSNNVLTSSIPAQIGELTNLEELRIDKNKFTGVLPSTIGSLISLTYLDLESNSFSHAVPSELGSLLQLEKFYLNGNYFSSIPKSFCAFKTTISLRIASNPTLKCLPTCLTNPPYTGLIKNSTLKACKEAISIAPSPILQTAQQVISNFVKNHGSILAYPSVLGFGLVAGLGVVFLRRSACREFNIVPLSSMDIITSTILAIMQALSSVMQLVEIPQSRTNEALICFVLIRLMMASVTLYIVFSALYRKSLSRFVVGACFHNATVWVAVSALALLDPSTIRFFCWKHSEFAKRSGGFPTIGVFYATLFSASLSALIMTILSATEYLHSYQGQASLLASMLAFVVSMATFIFRLRAENIHKIQVYIVDSEGLIVVREDGVFENNRRIEDSEKALEATKKELARLRAENEREMRDKEQEIRELREERAKMAQNIVRRASKNNDATESLAAAAVSEAQRVFTANVPFADENLGVLKNQLKDAGRQPLEYIPLDVLQKELDGIIIKVNAGDKYDERRLEHLLACLEINPQYKAEKEAERAAWKARITPFCADCLTQQRYYTPPHIFTSSFLSLFDEGLPVTLAKRFMAKPCLWMVRMKQADIVRLHEVELTNRYGSEGQGLDLVELAAIYACLPVETGFPNDPSGKKAAYMSRLEDGLKAAMAAQDAGKLPKTKQRASCYESAAPIYEHRQSLLERFITRSSEALGHSRDSFALWGRASRADTPSAASGVDIEMQGREFRLGGLLPAQRYDSASSPVCRERRLLGANLGQVVIDEIPNPMRTHIEG